MTYHQSLTRRILGSIRFRHNILGGVLGNIDGSAPTGLASMCSLLCVLLISPPEQIPPRTRFLRSFLGSFLCKHFRDIFDHQEDFFAAFMTPCLATSIVAVFLNTVLAACSPWITRVARTVIIIATILILMILSQSWHLICKFRIALQVPVAYANRDSAQFKALIERCIKTMLNLVHYEHLTNYPFVLSA
jgi:hypothetical protein